MAGEGPSLPSNYVTILHLKERWLKQQQQQSSKSNTIPQESDSVKPQHDSASASKIPNQSVYPTTNHHRIINQLKPDVKPHDSISKTPKESAHHRKNHHQTINQPKPKVTVHDSASKTGVKVLDNHQTVEKQKHNTDQFNPKSPKTKISSKNPNPRFVTDQIPTTPSEPEPELKPENKRHRNKGGHRNRKVEESKSKTLPVSRKLDDSSRKDSGGDVVAESVAAAVKDISIINVRQRTDRRWDSGGFRNGSAKPSFWMRKEQMKNTVWVRKGESAPN